jgi:hypothetical protein
MDFTHRAKVIELQGRLEVFNCSAPDRGNHLYVVSHPETQPAVEARFPRILDAYDLVPS